MIHITLIDYKKLYEDALERISSDEDRISYLKNESQELKCCHNAAVKRANDMEHIIDEERRARHEKNENLKVLIGGEGSLEERINAVNEKILSLEKSIEEYRDIINRKDMRIADLMIMGVSEEDDALKELHESYLRLHDDYYSLKTIYDNAQKTIDRLCSNE